MSATTSFVLPSLTIHAIPTGSVRVKPSHRNPGLGVGQILLDPRWTDWMPVYCWLIEHPEGLIVVDTGENERVLTDDYFACDPVSGWINRRILQFSLTQSLEIGPQLRQLGFSADQVRWVVLTHLHLDHVDGLHYFPKADILIARSEWERPFGAMMCLLPPWLRPHRIIHTGHEEPSLGAVYPLTAAGDVLLVPTPGHSHGHQSVLIKTPTADLLLAGDTTFDQAQLLSGQVPGISVDRSAARQTIQRIRDYARRRPLVYLPSHDPDSGRRLAQLSPLPS